MHFEYGIYKIGDYIMDLMKDIYKKELRTRIAAWEGKKTDDFQYEPERAELKAQMKDWLAETRRR